MTQTRKPAARKADAARANGQLGLFDAPRLGPATPLSVAHERWAAVLAEAETASATEAAFLGDLRDFAAFLRVDPAVGQITTADIQAWREHQRTQRGLAPKTYARRVTSVRAFFRWLHESGAVADDVAGKVVLETVRAPLPEVLTPAEERAAWAAAEALREGRDGHRADARHAALLALIVASGIKKGEALRLRWEHLEAGPDGQTLLHVRYAEARQQLFKGRKIVLPAPVMAQLQAHRAALDEKRRATGLVFPWTGRMLEYLLGELARAAGLTKPLTFDLLRWQCALRDLEHGRTEDEVRHKLGLSPKQWEEFGAHLRKLRAQRAARAAPPQEVSTPRT